MARTKFGFKAKVVAVKPKADYSGPSVEITLAVTPPKEPRPGYHQRSFEDLQKALDQNPKPTKKRGEADVTYQERVKHWEGGVAATRTEMERIQAGTAELEKAQREYKIAQRAYMLLTGALTMLLTKEVDIEASPAREADLPTGDIKALPAGRKEQMA